MKKKLFFAFAFIFMAFVVNSCGGSTDPEVARIMKDAEEIVKTMERADKSGDRETINNCNVKLLDNLLELYDVMDKLSDSDMVKYEKLMERSEVIMDKYTEDYSDMD